MDRTTQSLSFHLTVPHQLVVGAVLDCQGRPNACDLWPYKTTHVKALVQVADRRYIDCRNAD